MPSIDHESSEKLLRIWCSGWALGVIRRPGWRYILFYGTWAPNLKRSDADFPGLEGGIVIHGGLLAVLLQSGAFARRNANAFSKSWILPRPWVAYRLWCRRIGKLHSMPSCWGKATECPGQWYFRPIRLQLARHPSQLYPVCDGGVALFVILWLYSAKTPADHGGQWTFWRVATAYSLPGGVCPRRGPIHLGYLAFWLADMGQVPDRYRDF